MQSYFQVDLLKKDYRHYCQIGRPLQYAIWGFDEISRRRRIASRRQADRFPPVRQEGDLKAAAMADSAKSLRLGGSGLQRFIAVAIQM